MIRFLILSGYFELMMYLQVSGKLDQYINTHYRYLAILSMILSLILAVVQLIQWVKNDGKAHQHEEDGHQHLTTRKQKIVAYLMLSLPLAVGLLFPTVSLDTTIVDAKGFNFPLSQDSTGDSEVRTQYLRPDTSIYFNKSDYKTMMEKVKEKYIDNDTVTITSENYLEVMELIYDYPSEFIGKKITYTGFVYTDPTKTDNQVFLFRFGIIHCVADSGVFGLLNKLPDDVTVKNNDWLTVKGEIVMDYYQPFKRDLPIVQVTQAKIVKTPSNQYVYRSF
jgi:putative membrane protein